MRRPALLLATIVTIALFSTMPLLAAHSAEYPNTAAGCAPAGNVPAPGGKTGMTLYYRKLIGPQEKITTGDKNFGACTPGGAVVTDLSNELCKACTKLPGGNVIGGCAGIPADGASFTCQVNVVDRFTVWNSATIPVPFPADTCSAASPCPVPAVVAKAAAGNILLGMNRTTDAGNELRVDLLPDLHVQITPRGTDGNVVFHAELGPSPGLGPSFTVNTTSKKQSQIAQEVANGFIAMGYSASQVSNGDISGKSQDPQLFNGSSTRVSNIGTLNGTPVKFVSVQGVPPSVPGQPGMLVEVENSEPPSTTFVPAVSEWTIALFIGLVLLMGTWLLRRRLTPQAPQAV